MTRTKSEPSETTKLPDFDKFWDYNQSEKTETQFRSLLETARESADRSYLAQLLTQIARTQGLQRKFDEAHRTLDEVEKMLDEGLRTAKVRYLLERGRAFNSSKHPDKARPLFLEAWELAQAAGEDSHAVDAAHMMGIIEAPGPALEWNERAIAFAERSDNARARGWLGSLYNNVGWIYHGKSEYGKALELFEKALELRQEKKQEPQLRIAKWCVARTLRSLGRVEEALGRQRELLAALEAIGEEDGFVFEELGECLLLLGKAEQSRPYFAQAHRALAADPWLAESEPERIARLKDLSSSLVT